MMKLIAQSLLAATYLVLSPPAAAESATIIGSGDVRMCERLATKYGNTSPSDQWKNQCRQAAAEQDNCVRATGWAPGKPATAATTACWENFDNKVRSLPR
jgi:hypothetical protein